MITLNLTFEDLKQMRFAYSLLTEVILSFRALCTPSLYTTYAPWIEETRARLRGVNLDYMRALISPQGLVPDFLIPLPAIGASRQCDVEIESPSKCRDNIAGNRQSPVETCGGSE